jgi:hypothetical protein
MAQRENPASWKCGARGTSLGKIDPSRLATNRPAAQAQSSARQRLRRQRLVEWLHRLGPAPLGHFLDEIERGASITDHPERYSRIDPEFVRALGGDRFPPALHVIDGGGRS